MHNFFEDKLHLHSSVYTSGDSCAGCEKVFILKHQTFGSEHYDLRPNNLISSLNFRQGFIVF